MKKTYIIPSVETMPTLPQQPMAVSGVTAAEGMGIGYGGVDTEGTVDPDVKADVFDFEWE
ncbi:MAG: hypothetical protein IJS59_00765 [Bacteroidaceae bacterium]|nr:hypothetical protein [Bacteroidaceae bacterium]